ncbi:short-chain dehydrogenase, partial [Pseudomassariella vexata]
MPRVTAKEQRYPGPPQWTEEDIADQKGKVCIVTGSNTGIGYEVARILYAKNAMVYVAARNEIKGREAIQRIREAHPSSAGRLEFLQLDLADLEGVRNAACRFKDAETKLHVLFNNAGEVMHYTKTAPHWRHQLAVNCIGPFLFTRLLMPIMEETAKSAAKNSVRVVWVSSSAAELATPHHGVPMCKGKASRDAHGFEVSKYGITKAGNYYHATQFARKYRHKGVISVALNPGHVKSNIHRHVSATWKRHLRGRVYPTVCGAYTELFAGVSDQVTLAKTGCWIVPWGRFTGIRDDLWKGAWPKEELGDGVAERFWTWTENQI